MTVPYGLTIAIIPARANSKSIPNKNMRLLKGKPVLFWTLDLVKSALEHRLIDLAIFTTESESYRESVLAHYKNSRMMREKMLLMPRHESLSHDWVQNDDVVMDVIRKSDDWVPPKSIGILLQPTSPFRDYKHIVDAVQIKRYLQGRKEGTVISGHMLDTRGFIWKVDENEMLHPMGHDPTRRLGRQWDEGYKEQRIFKEDGSIYVFDWDTTKRTRTFRNAPFIPLITDPVVDLDEPEDWDSVADDDDTFVGIDLGKGYPWSTPERT